MFKCKVGLAKIAGFESSGFPQNHPMKKERVWLTLKALEKTGALSEIGLLETNRPASEGALMAFHEKSYIDFVRKMSQIGTGLLDYGDTPAFPGCYDSSASVVQASLLMIEKLAEFDHTVNLYGGLHHAMPARASGFCIFNDVSIAIKHLLNKGVRRMAYIDIDAHHGDGVMYGFYSDVRILNIDFHEDGRYLFPGTGFIHEMGEGDGEGKKVNVVLPPNASDSDLIYSFNRIVPPLLEGFKPEIILFQAGVDAHEDDPLTHLRFTERGYKYIYSKIHALSHSLCGGDLLVFGGGGYNLNNVVKCWTHLVHELSGVESKFSISELAEKITADFEDKVEHGHKHSSKESLDSPSDKTIKNIGSLEEELRKHGWSI
jgi:acetoin utilization protein AcuC